MQEVQLAILVAVRSQVRHFCLAALRPAALQPAAGSPALRNLLPAALQPCSLLPCNLAVQRFGLFTKAILKSN